MPRKSQISPHQINAHRADAQTTDESANDLFNKHLKKIGVRTDRLFGKLFLLEYVVGIVAALVVSPRTWVGAESMLHLHVYVAVILGGILVSFPLFLIRYMPGETATRHVVAVSQMLISAMWIHLSGGRIETHFHVFGSLAFLSFYRDWRVLVSASLVVAGDHFFRGVYFPESVYGILSTSSWRWFEHTAWVVFEDIFLFLAISQSVQEMRAIAKQQAEAQTREKELAVSRVRAEEASQTKSAFLANMSHEIRTPLGAMLGFTQLMLEDRGCSFEQHDTLKTILRNGKQLYRVIDDILDISKVEANKIEIEHTRFRLDEVVNDVVSLMNFKAEEKGLRLQIKRLAPLPETIISDSTRLRQILFNIIGNAVKFTEKGSVDVCIAHRSDVGEGTGSSYLEVKVADTGPGIPAEKRQKLFLPFTQADNTTSRKFGGTGLGLYLSKRLAHGLGGDLWFEEPPSGRGSVFVFTVETGPLDSPDLVDVSNLRNSELNFARPDESGSSVSGRLKGVSVLCVDDSPDNLVLTSRFLRASEASVECINSGIGAVQLVQEKTFDVILMDIQMPSLDGYETVARLREMKYSGPVVALTAHAMKGERERCLATGFDDYLVKPIDRNDLIQVVANQARRRHLSPDTVAPVAGTVSLPILT